jgi:hypothetical protein
MVLPTYSNFIHSTLKPLKDKKETILTHATSLPSNGPDKKTRDKTKRKFLAHFMHTHT